MGWTLAILGVGIAVFVQTILIPEIEYRKKHPGFDDYCSNLDDELTAIGE